MTTGSGPYDRSTPGLLSVIIPVRNGESTIADQLGALAIQTYTGAWELIVSNNGSTDGTIDIVEAFRPRIPDLRIVTSTQPGINVARNAGVRAARGDYLLFCDADDVATSTWIEAMAAMANRCDLVGGPLEKASLNETETLQWRRTRAFDDNLPILHGFLPSPYGANCGFRAEICETIGLWDERYRGGGDDVEFFWRAQQAGYRLCSVSDAVMRYRFRKDLGAWVRQAFHWGRANTLLFKDFHTTGMPRSSTVSLFREFGWLLLHVGDLRTTGGRGRWLGKVAWRAGRLAGSLRNLVWYP